MARKRKKGQQRRCTLVSLRSAMLHVLRSTGRSPKRGCPSSGGAGFLSRHDSCFELQEGVQGLPLLMLQSVLRSTSSGLFFVFSRSSRFSATQSWPGAACFFRRSKSDKQGLTLTMNTYMRHLCISIVYLHSYVQLYVLSTFIRTGIVYMQFMSR